MTGNVPNLVKETDVQVQEVQRVPNKMEPKRPAPRHIIIKMAKVKKRIVKAAARETQLITYKSALLRLTADFSTETFQARGTGVENIQRDEKQGPTSKITPPSKAIVWNGRTKTFPDKEKLKDFITIKPILKEMLMGPL